jgi:CheY-like chemotaxis protein
MGPILIVDDDPTVRALVGDVLGAAGHTVITATNGYEGLQRVATDHPALVLLDLTMPVLDGYGFLRHLQQTDRHLPVIVISVNAHEVLRSEQAGVIGTCPKPFDLDHLVAAVEMALAA